MSLRDVEQITESLEETLLESELTSVGTEVSEIAIDLVIDDGVLKDVPIISTLVGLGKTAASVREYLFLKKIIAFITKISTVSKSDRQKMVKRINESDDFKVKVGEKLLYLIDKTEDHETAGIIGLLFAAFVENKMDYSDFLRCSVVVNSVFVEDLKSFVSSDSTYVHIENAGELVGTSLYSLEADPVEVNVDDQSDHKVLRDGGSKYTTDVDGGQFWAHVTSTGEIMRDVLKEKI